MLVDTEKTYRLDEKANTLFQEHRPTAPGNAARLADFSRVCLLGTPWERSGNAEL